MPERPTPQEPSHHEQLTPAQLITKEIMGNIGRDTNLDFLDDVTRLALYLRVKGLSAQTIKPVIDSGMFTAQLILGSHPKPSNYEQAWATIANLSFLSGDQDPLSRVPKDQVEETTVALSNSILPFFAERVVDVLRATRDDTMREGYNYIGDLSDEIYDVLEGNSDVSTLEKTNDDLEIELDRLGKDLFVDRGGMDYHGPFSTEDDYTKYDKVQDLIEQAKTLQA